MDIRNYFSAPNANKKLGKKTTTKKGSSKRRIQDSDDDELGDHKASKTSTSQEASASKSNTSTPTRQSTRLNRKNTKVDEPTTKKERERSDTTKSNVNKDDDFMTMRIDDETSPPQSTSENPEIFTTPRRSRKTTEVAPKAVTKKRSKKIDDDDDFVLEEESKSHSPPKKTKREQKEATYKPSINRAIKTPRSKRQNVEDEDDEKDIEGRTSITPNKVQDNSEIVTTSIKVEENDSPDIIVDRSNLNKADPTTPESKEIPQGEEMCLYGKTFVFTGDLSMDREEAQDLVKRHGGRITLQPSSKTSYVVIGQDSRPRKTEKHFKFRVD